MFNIYHSVIVRRQSEFFWLSGLHLMIFKLERWSQGRVVSGLFICFLIVCFLFFIFYLFFLVFNVGLLFLGCDLLYICI